LATGLRTKTVTDEDWLLDFCRIREAWALTPPRPTGRPKGEGVTVIHPDTGYTQHPEVMHGGNYLIADGVARNFVPGVIRSHPEFLSAKDTLDTASASHGTKTASVMISAEGGPSAAAFPGYSAAKAVWGVAPKANVIPYRVATWVNLDDEACIRLAKAIYYAVGNEDLKKVGVISISLGRASLGFIEKETYIRTAFEQAKKNGVIVCAAAGQLQQDGRFQGAGQAFSPAFPARDPNAICVAGCNADHTPMPSGFLGPEVDVTAPAYDLWVAASKLSAPQSEAYEVYQSWGTSYATAITAGACALWQAYHGREWLLDPANCGPELIFKLFKEILKRSTHKPPGWDSTKRGVGVLDVEALLREPLPPKAEIVALPDN
jgi:serine protease